MSEHPHSATVPPIAEPNHTKTRSEKIGEELSFGVQQTIACYLTDFIDPPISRFLQNKFGDPNHEVTHEQVWYAEFVGDFSALAVYLFVKRAFGRSVDALTRKVEDLFDDKFTRMAKKSANQWADHHGVGKDDPRYGAKVQEYKDFHAHNLVDTGIISTSSTLLNVLAQKYIFHNQQKLPVILGSKVAGAILTMGVMLGLRMGMPTNMHKFDQWTSRKVAAPAVRATQRLFGVNVDPVEPDALPAAATQVTAHDAAMLRTRQMERSVNFVEAQAAQSTQSQAATPALM